MAAVNEVKLPCLRPGEMADISVLMMAPSESRMYHGQWQMCTQSGENFGGKSTDYWNSTVQVVITGTWCN